MKNYPEMAFPILPALLAILYPLALSVLSAGLQLFGASAPPKASLIAAIALAILFFAAMVMAASFVWARRLGEAQSEGAAPARGRVLAHLAFAAPSLLVGFGNVAGILHARMAVAYAWPGFWILLILLTLALPNGLRPLALSAAARKRLALAHGISALCILLLFLLPHIGNHLTGFWNGATHIAVMKLARLLYRDSVVEPVLLLFIAFQIASGAILVWRRLSLKSELFGTLQTLTGVYVGIYLLAHMTAAFSARLGGTDTNWNWLTNDDRGLLAQLSSFTLVAHYWVGPVALFTHLGGGLRLVMIEHGLNERLAGRVVFALMVAGAAMSSVILLGLLGAHLA